MRIALLAVAIAPAFVSLDAHAQLYRWTDAAGKTHVTDTPPPPSAKKVEKRAASVASSAPAEPFALAKARKENPITLFSTPTCEPCVQARKLLNTRGIPFEETSVQDAARFEELKKKAGADTVPVMLVGGEVVKGFDEKTYNQALDVAGYPKAGVLAPRNQAAPATAPVFNKPEATAEAQEEKPVVPRGPYAPKAPR